MPISRFITDLDHLTAEFGSGTPSSGQSYTRLRMAVARMNELQRQIEIAHDKLGAILALAEMKIIYNQVDLSDEEAPLGERFALHVDCLSGHSEVDADHLAIFTLGNRLDALCAQNDVGRQAIADAMDDLIDKVRSSFAREQSLMLAHAYPGLSEHQRTHERMLGYLQDMSAAAQQPLTVAIRLEKLLGSWLVWHIQREDLDFVRATRKAATAR